MNEQGTLHLKPYEYSVITNEISKNSETKDIADLYINYLPEFMKSNNSSGF